jgi:hypothetical protein
MAQRVESRERERETIVGAEVWLRVVKVGVPV